MKFKEKGTIIGTLRFLVLIGALGLVLIISVDTLQSRSFIADPTYLRMQLWICLLFLLDSAVEIAMSGRRWHFVLTHILFILVSIPWLNILEWTSTAVPGGVAGYLLRLLPMVRVAFVLAIVAGAFTSSRAAGVLVSYVALLAMVAYFCSMTFWVEEHDVNPGARSYWNALWWSAMCLTTTGSNISAFTLTGRIISVILSAGGLLLFPLFTVYFTSKTHSSSVNMDQHRNTPSTSAGGDLQPQSGHEPAKAAP